MLGSHRAQAAACYAEPRSTSSTSTPPQFGYRAPAPGRCAATSHGDRGLADSRQHVPPGSLGLEGQPQRHPRRSRQCRLPERVIARMHPRPVLCGEARRAAICRPVVHPARSGQGADRPVAGSAAADPYLLHGWMSETPPPYDDLLRAVGVVRVGRNPRREGRCRCVRRPGRHGHVPRLGRRRGRLGLWITIQAHRSSISCAPNVPQARQEQRRRGCTWPVSWADGGAPPGTRTPNRCLKRALLCQLS